jgi:hypothetical protein
MHICFSWMPRQLPLSLKITVSWDRTPCSLAYIYQCFRGTFCLHLYGSSSTLKMEGAHFSKMLVNIYETAWHRIPENGKLHSHWKSPYISPTIFNLNFEYREQIAASQCNVVLYLRDSFLSSKICQLWTLIAIII